MVEPYVPFLVRLMLWLFRIILISPTVLRLTLIISLLTCCRRKWRKNIDGTLITRFVVAATSVPETFLVSIVVPAATFAFTNVSKTLTTFSIALSNLSSGVTVVTALSVPTQCLSLRTI